ncbi:MAG: hypothetical protein AAGC55_16580 [Myxococcota bacterium]
MAFHPIFAFLRKPAVFGEVAERFVGALRERFPRVKYERLQLDARDHLDVRMYNEHDEIALEVLRDGTIMVEFWEFDPDVHDEGGPTRAMAEHKWHSAVRTLTALTDAVGARFAYLASPEFKHAEEWQLECEEGFATSLRAFDDSGNLAPFQAAIRNDYLLWMMAVRKDEPVLRTCIERTWPSWDRVADSEFGQIFENRDAKRSVVFMDPNMNRRWHDDPPQS